MATTQTSIYKRKKLIYFQIVIAIALACLAGSSSVFGQRAAESSETQINAPYVPTPQSVVDEMLKLAAITSNDTVYDLGCGDGRIVVSAAKKYGARGVGIDLNPQRIEEARENAKQAGVDSRAKFAQANVYDADLREATVVTLYLLPDMNRRLRPKLLKELKPGTRIVSHAFGFGDWQPEKELVVGGSHIYLWTVPANKTLSGE